MSGYTNGRRAPNVSQYIANLNTIPTPQEIAAQNDFDLGSEGLDFLNTEFFDFDASTFDANGDFARQHAEVQHQQRAATNGMEPGHNYQYTEFQTYPQHSLANSPNAVPHSPANNLPGPYQAQPNHFVAHAASGEKRQAVAANFPPVGDLEETSRMAAEEDKRRRNTAASARFRVKKKQREQALEKQAKEMTDKVSQLEGKVQQLEMENKWLKGLITEKSDMKGMEEQFRKFVEEKGEEGKTSDSSSRDERTDGVGTAKAEDDDDEEFDEDEDDS